MNIPSFTDAQEDKIQEVVRRIFGDSADIFSSCIELNPHAGFELTWLDGYKFVWVLLSQLNNDERTEYIQDILSAK